MRTLRRVLLAVVVLLVAGGPAFSDTTKPKHGRPHQLPQTGTDDAPGVTPDATAEAELEAMTNRSSVGLTVVTRTNGTQVVDLEGRFMSVAVAGPSGATCHTGTKAVKQARKAKSKAKAKPAKPMPAKVPTINGLEVM
jgi:hypothetical protein